MNSTIFFFFSFEKLTTCTHIEITHLCVNSTDFILFRKFAFAGPFIHSTVHEIFCCVFSFTFF